MECTRLLELKYLSQVSFTTQGWGFRGLAGLCGNKVGACAKFQKITLHASVAGTAITGHDERDRETSKAGPYL